MPKRRADASCQQVAGRHLSCKHRRGFVAAVLLSSFALTALGLLGRAPQGCHAVCQSMPSHSLGPLYLRLFCTAWFILSQVQPGACSAPLGAVSHLHSSVLWSNCTFPLPNAALQGVCGEFCFAQLLTQVHQVASMAKPRCNILSF